jgi:hypothetical protein
MTLAVMGYHFQVMTRRLSRKPGRGRNNAVVETA